MLLEAMDKKLANHKHYTSRQLNPMDKELKHKEEFRIRYVTPPVVQFVLNYCSPAVNFNNIETKLRMILKSKITRVNRRKSDSMCRPSQELFFS
jgi:hypothetical protein